MKKHYFLPLLQGAYFWLIILLLQSCGGLGNVLLEEEPAEMREQIERQVSIIRANQEQEQESNSLPAIMPELWQEIFSYLDFKEVLAARSVSADWNRLITGFREAGIVGVENKTSHIIDARSWVKRKDISFRDNKLKELTPAAIPSFAFYHLMGHVHDLPQSFWPYLKNTQVHTLNLACNEIDDQGARQLAKALSATRVHTLYLNWNRIGSTGASELTRALPDTHVHTLDLGNNEIGSAGASELAKALPATRVHTLNLESNQIGDAGAVELAKALPDTRVHTLYLENNRIGVIGAIKLAKALPDTRVHTLYLENNRIGVIGAIKLAKALPDTRVHTLYLENNQIGDEGAIELAKALPATQVHTLDLNDNQIGSAGASELAKALPATRVHTLYLNRDLLKPQKICKGTHLNICN
jgi:hypothetical protein